MDDFWPAVSDASKQVKPAVTYLLSLNSPRSRQIISSFLDIVASRFGAADSDSCNWGVIRRHHVMGITELLHDTGRATATVNTYLSAFKSAAKEAWMLKLMDTESYQHIRAVRNLRGSRLPRGHALTSDEIRRLFRICDDDSSSLGPRYAALLAVLLGYDLRCSEAVSLSNSDVITQERTLKVIGRETSSA